jgi:hypothetical protein
MDKTYKTLIYKILLDRCNIIDYLSFLKNVKSNELTEWFHPPAGHTDRTKYSHEELMSYQWPTRLIIICQYTKDKNIWREIFNMIITLANNNAKFCASKTLKFCIRNLLGEWTKHYNEYNDCDYYDLYSFLSKMNSKILTDIYQFIKEYKPEYNEYGKSVDKCIHKLDKIRIEIFDLTKNICCNFKVNYIDKCILDFL